jgi:hypothetical protein
MRSACRVAPASATAKAEINGCGQHSPELGVYHVTAEIDLAIFPMHNFMFAPDP